MTERLRQQLTIWLLVVFGFSMVALDLVYALTDVRLYARLGSLSMVLLLLTGFARVSTGESMVAIGAPLTIAGLFGAWVNGRWESYVVVLGLAAYVFAGYHLLHERKD